MRIFSEEWVILFFKLISILYPAKCPFCDATINEKDCMCESCKGEFFDSGFKSKVLPDNDQNIFVSVAPFVYDGEVKKAICSFKFQKRQDYAVAFANAAYKAIIEHYKEESFDVVTSVPLFCSNLNERGYNQSELFAKALARKLHVKHKRLLVKTKQNLIQHNLDYEMRASNVKGVYSSKNKDFIKNKKILLCDDILTSGNTMNECASVLRNSGAYDIKCATIAVARKINK